MIPRFCAGGAVGSKSYLMVVEIHDAAMIRTLTSPIAAMYLAAGAFFSVKMATLGFHKPCCCYVSCRRRFFSVKMTTQDLTSPVAANQLAAGAFFLLKMAIQDLTSPVAANQPAAGAFSANMATNQF